MQKQIEQLIKFHSAYEVPIAPAPLIPHTSRIELRNRLLLEEAKELYEATNVVEAFDGLIDVLYIAFGTALEYGLHHRLEAGFDEVQRSNMSKLGEDGKPIKRHDGKILKGPNFTMPDLQTVLSGKVNNADPHYSLTEVVGMVQYILESHFGKPISKTSIKSLVAIASTNWNK